MQQITYRNKNKVMRINPYRKRPFAFKKQALQYHRWNYYDYIRNRFEFEVSALVYKTIKIITNI